MLAMRDDDGVADLRGFGVVGLSGLSTRPPPRCSPSQAADLTPGQRLPAARRGQRKPAGPHRVGRRRALGDPAAGGPPTLRARAVHQRAPGARRVRFAGEPAAGGTRLALLVAAAEDTGELGVVLDAAERIGLGLNDFEPAERPGCPCRRRWGHLPAPADPFGGIRTRTRRPIASPPIGRSPVRCRSTPTGEHGTRGRGRFRRRSGRSDGGCGASRRPARRVRGERGGARTGGAAYRGPGGAGRAAGRRGDGCP